MQSYQYENRDGVVRISWDRFAGLAKSLAEKLAGYEVDCVVGIARAGLFPATAVACALRRELFPVRLTRRVDDRVVHERPMWKVYVPHDVQGKKVVVVDEIADTGETLALAAERVRWRGAREVVTATLVSHSWAKPAPDAVALVSDALIVFPWDEQVYMDGIWRLHPELEEALKLQGSGGI